MKDIERPETNLQEAMDRLKNKTYEPSMSKKEAIKVLKQTGEYLYYHIGTDSYDQRCRLYDAARVLEL